MRRSSATATSRRRSATAIRTRRRSPGTAIDAVGVRARGGSAVGRELVERFRDPRRLWVHLDVDVLDEAVFPATDYLMPGGLVWRELTDLLGPLLTSPSLVGASVGCYNPTKDPDGAGARALVEAFRAVFSG